MKYSDLFKVKKSNVIQVLSKDIKSTRRVFLKLGLLKYRKKLRVIKNITFNTSSKYVYLKEIEKDHTIIKTNINFYKHIKFYVRKYGSKYTRNKFIRIGLNSYKKHYWSLTTYDEDTNTDCNLKYPLTIKAANDYEEFNYAIDNIRYRLYF